MSVQATMDGRHELYITDMVEKDLKTQVQCLATISYQILLVHLNNYDSDLQYPPSMFPTFLGSLFPWPKKDGSFLITQISIGHFHYDITKQGWPLGRHLTFLGHRIHM